MLYSVSKIKSMFKKVFCTIVIFSLGLPLLYCQQEKQEFAGEFSAWAVKIPMGNYYFVKNTIKVFGPRWNAAPATEQELVDRVWDELVLSFESYRRDIKVEQKDLEEEINKTLSSEKVSFDWKTDKEAYTKWLKERIGVSIEIFENQLRHLIQLENLRKQVLESIKPSVTEQESYQEFLNEYNTLELELLQFDQLKDAEVFYNKMKDASLWDEEKKKDAKFSKITGFVSLEFLIEMWKIPKDDLYKMLKLEVNSIYPPTPFYKGYGVFRILQKRVAQESDFSKQRDSYFKQVETIKKFEGFKMWLKHLKEEAKVKPYVLPQIPNVSTGEAK